VGPKLRVGPLWFESNPKPVWTFLTGGGLAAAVTGIRDAIPDFFSTEAIAYDCCAIPVRGTWALAEGVLGQARSGDVGRVLDLRNRTDKKRCPVETGFSLGGNSRFSHRHSRQRYQRQPRTTRLAILSRRRGRESLIDLHKSLVTADAVHVDV